jgi:hypothetical protein
MEFSILDSFESRFEIALMKLYDIFLFQISKKKLKLQILKAIKIV